MDTIQSLNLTLPDLCRVVCLRSPLFPADSGDRSVFMPKLAMGSEWDHPISFDSAHDAQWASKF